VYEIVWEFQPAPDCEREFESVYGASGAWVELFRRDAGFLGTELVRPRQPGEWYRTIDRWDSRTSYQRFRERWAAEYEALDRASERLTRAERPVDRGADQ
jgi:heme-degrading monooxygenase HmoA